MNTYVALLRGINVGGNKKVSMSTLKKAFEEMGHSNVKTYINSGNVIFETSKTDSMLKIIERKLESTFGFQIGVVLRSIQNIENVCKEIPSDWTNDAMQKTDVIFLWEKYASEKSMKMIVTKPEIDTLIYVDGAIVWNIKRANYSKSGMHKFIGTKVYKNMTARNVNTVRKLAELMGVKKD